MNVVALFASPDADAAATTEFLRVVAAWRAVGVAVRLLECGNGAGVLSSPERTRSSDGERYLAALAEDGVVPERDADVAGAISEASAIVAALDPSRPGTPPLLRLERGARPAPDDVDALLAAGQVTLG